MVVRLPGAGSNVPTPSVGFPLPTDPRRDMMREAIAARIAAELSDVESKLKEIVQTGEARLRRTDPALRRGGPDRGGPVTAGPPTTGTTGTTGTTPTTSATPPTTTTAVAGTTGAPPTAPTSTPPPTTTPAPPTPPPTSEQVQRALQLLQRDAGLPVTGRFDEATVAMLGRLGLTTPADAATKPTAPSSPAPPAERKPIDLAGQAQRRQAAAGQEQLLKARLQVGLPAAATTPTARASSKAEAFRAETPEVPVDRALDPARLLASLVAAGFRGASSASHLGEALQAFQTAKGLPPTGQLDKPTAAALQSAADHSHAGEGARTTTSAASSRDRVDVASQTKGSGAQTQAATTRAPAASPEEAREQARLESLFAQADAVERGVQATTGDLAATAGNAPTAGQATGVSGAGGSGGGADAGGDEAAHDLEGPAGEETSVGNSAAGDDDHDDDDRGEAVAAGQADDVGEDDDGLIPDGHYRVERLSVQVQAALETIARLDGDDGPVHYTWDVTLYRPGVYADGQPAEAVWHLVVDRAHAFDPVWQRATHAIAARLLYAEPEAIAPSLDDVLGALRRARVR